MGDRKVTVTIDAMGNPKFEAHGFNGQGCEDATRGLEQALSGGSGGVEKTYKDEWYNEADEAEQQHMTW